MKTMHQVTYETVAVGGGVELLVASAGDAGRGETVLLVHGFPDSHRLWQQQVRARSRRP